MKIPSIAQGSDLAGYSIYSANRSRDFFYHCLINLRKHNIKEILIPSYIGYTISEGSGVMDAIIDARFNYQIYPIEVDLKINKRNLLSMIKNVDFKSTALLFIHYFGIIDKNYNDIASFAKEKGIFIFDDCAHAYYTYYLYRDYFLGDAVFFSMHKLVKNINSKSIALIKRDSKKFDFFRFQNNIKKKKKIKNYNDVKNINIDVIFSTFPSIQNADSIIKKRIYQVEIYKNNFKQYFNHFKILLKEDDYQYPLQSFPILFSEKINRDYVFSSMRNLGIHVVSLYYNLSEKITLSKFPDAHFLSKNILNLPVNEDLDKDQIQYICNSLIKICNL